MQVLAELLEIFRTGGNEQRLAELLGQQARLKVALDLLPDALPQTRQLARMAKQDLVDTGQITAARRELSEAMREISPSYGPLPGPFE